MWITPTRPHVVISGFPATEGNALEMVREGARRYPGKVFWLVPDTTAANRLLVRELSEMESVTVLPHRSWRAAWRTATAEVVMFTHGVYSNPSPVAKKTMVNLWHGGGIKGNLMSGADGRPTIRSDFLVAATHRIGKLLADQSWVPHDRLLVLGNPRVAQFGTGSRESLAKLGVAADQHFVVWMPTYRKNRGLGLTTKWSDVSEGSAELNAAISDGISALHERGIKVIVKLHPQDGESRDIEGAQAVTNGDLADVGIQLYELLGMASGLITDYSSVWIDYLGLDRPIGFVVPDQEAYANGRGFNPPDALDWLPGPRLSTKAEFLAFADDVVQGGRLSRSRRSAVAEHWGHVYFPNAPELIWDELEARGVFAHRRRRNSPVSN